MLTYVGELIRGIASQNRGLPVLLSSALVLVHARQHVRGRVARLTSFEEIIGGSS